MIIPKSDAPKPKKRTGRMITIKDEIDGKIFERKVYIKEEENIYKKMMSKLNKKNYTKPSGEGIYKPCKGLVIKKCN